MTVGFFRKMVLKTVIHKLMLFSSPYNRGIIRPAEFGNQLNLTVLHSPANALLKLVINCQLR